MRFEALYPDKKPERSSLRTGTQDPEVVDKAFHHMFQLMEYEPSVGITEAIFQTRKKYPDVEEVELRKRFIKLRGGSSPQVEDMLNGLFEQHTPKISDRLEILRGGNPI